ncbi:MAG TPA: hypothetical protein V6C78_07265 [Crinalium sp.]|jgi:cytoskeletal protein RodZ
MKSLLLSVLSWAIALLITLTGLIAPPAFAEPLLQTNATIAQTATDDVEQQEPSSETAPATEEKSEEAGEKSDRQSSESESTSTQSSSEKTPPPSAGPYDMDNIQNFNRALYGS